MTDPLPTRQRQVLNLLARGNRLKQIAHALEISESTTKIHIRDMREALGARTTAEAIYIATKAGLIEDPK